MAQSKAEKFRVSRAGGIRTDGEMGYVLEGGMSQSKGWSDNLVGVGSNTISRDLIPGLLTALQVH